MEHSGGLAHSQCRWIHWCHLLMTYLQNDYVLHVWNQHEDNLLQMLKHPKFRLARLGAGNLLQNSVQKSQSYADMSSSYVPALSSCPSGEAMRAGCNIACYPSDSLAYNETQFLNCNPHLVLSSKGTTVPTDAFPVRLQLTFCLSPTLWVHTRSPSTGEEVGLWHWSLSSVYFEV